MSLTREQLLTNEQKLFRIARNRLQTFGRNEWPSDVPVPPETLAESGFLLKPKEERQYDDEVVCNYCHKKLFGWKAGDDPFKAHLKLSPHCDFMMGYYVGNIPLDGHSSSDPIRGRNRRVQREPDLCGPHPFGLLPQPSVPLPSNPLLLLDPMSSQESSESNSSQGSSSGSESGSPTTSRSSFLNRPSLGLNYIQQHVPPSHPNYVTLQSRLSTFPADWKDFCPIDASSLAEAGFFYDGPIRGVKVTPEGKKETLKDAVTCFHCSKRLYNWELNDDPWEEHRKLNEKCYFVRLNFLDGRRRTSTAADLKSLGAQLSKLSQEYNEKRSHENSAGNCKVCWDKEVEILFLPCRHANSCGSCASSLSKCPTCRGNIEGTVRIFLS